MPVHNAGIAAASDETAGLLDLSDTRCRMAKDEGVLLGIDSDAHDTAGFDGLA